MGVYTHILYAYSGVWLQGHLDKSSSISRTSVNFGQVVFYFKEGKDIRIPSPQGRVHVLKSSKLESSIWITACGNSSTGVLYCRIGNSSTSVLATHSLVREYIL